MKTILNFCLFFSIVLISSTKATDISLENKSSSDNYNLYYNTYSLNISNISTQFGTVSWESFYDDLGLSNQLNGINTFESSLIGSRLYLSHHWKNFYYMLGTGNDNFENMKENFFYDVALAYLIPLGPKTNLILNSRVGRSRFQKNPFALYLGIPNQTTSFSAQIKRPKLFVEAAYSFNNLEESPVPADLLVNNGLIETIPTNKMSSFYIYGYTPILANLNAGVVYSVANSDVNVFQATFTSYAQNLYTYFPYFTPVNSKAWSVLFFGDKDVNIGALNLGTFSFKAQVPIVSSTNLLYEVKEGIITAGDSVYYNYSGVEPLNLELSWTKKNKNDGLSFKIGYNYFDKPYIKNEYFGDDLVGYHNNQISFTILKSL